MPFHIKGQPMRSLVKMIVAGILCCVAASGYAGGKQAAKDPMAWLGPLPTKLDEKMLQHQLTSLHKSVKRDLRGADINLNRFVCKRPSEIGPTPHMEAVRAYLDAWPDSRDDPVLVRGLLRAAEAGNWLARVQLYVVLHPRSLAGYYRQLQLAKWMQQRKLGALYAQFGDALAASGYYSDEPGNGITGIDVFAAFHGSYPAQHKVGTALITSPDTAATGRAMIECASTALPEYGRIFSGEAEKAAERRRQAARDARLPAIHQAVISGDPDQVSRQLAAAPATVEVRNEDDQTALDMALIAKPPLPQIVSMLITSGARVTDDHPVDSSGNATQLGMADAAPVPTNLELVKMLMKAGANPFTMNKVHKYVFETPFANAASRFDEGKDAAVFEFMLASGRLAAHSALATQYADHFAASRQVFDRLMAYGVIPSGEMFTKAIHLEEAGLSGWLRQLRELLDRHPHLRSAMQAEQGAAALAQAVHQCRFDVAIGLANLGAPLKDGLVRMVAEGCDDLDLKIRNASGQPRRQFLELLVARGYDLNANDGSCVAWIPSCLLPSEGLVRELLVLGADPYRFGFFGDTNGVLAAIKSCNAPLAELMLATPPTIQDAASQAGLDQAAEKAADPYFCSQKTDMRTILARLLSYGAAQPEPKPDGAR